MRTQKNQILFAQKWLRDILESNNDSIQARIDSLPKEQFLNTPPDTLAEHFVNLLFINPLKIYDDKMVLEEDETKVDVSHIRARNPLGERGPLYINGIKVTVSFPYTGDFELWNVKPTNTQASHPVGNARNPNSEGIGYIDIVFERPIDEDGGNIRNSIDEQVRKIKLFIENQSKEIETYNSGLEKKTHLAIRNRKERIKRHDGIIETIGIPLKKKSGIPEIRPINVRRKLIRPLPKPPKEGYNPEPGITEDDYEYILSIIRHEGKTFETTPKTYAVHDEEELRDILLAHLNGHFQGEATGETFRRKGRTDIRIEDQERAAFVAECKIWDGEKEILKGMNQLLGYLTWRDCKSSIIIFNKYNAKFTELLLKVPAVLSKHKNLVKNLGGLSAGEWRFIFSSLEDELRNIIVHVFLFNLYVKE